jgi:hypothetical protein
MPEATTLAELAARRGEAVIAGEMTDFCGGRAVIGAIGKTPVILSGYPVILGTPELDAEFTRIWRKACGLAGIREVPGVE